jgi:histidinol-phosphate aminotransferase
MSTPWALQPPRLHWRTRNTLGWEYVPAVTNFFLLKVGNGKAVFNALLRHGIIARPMDVYGLPDYIRITVGTTDENSACLAALKRVLTEVEIQ